MRRYRRGVEAKALYHQVPRLLEETLIDMQCEQEIAPRQVGWENNEDQELKSEMIFWLRVKESS